MTPALQKTTSRWMDRWTGGSGRESVKLNGQSNGLTIPGLIFDWWPPSTAYLLKHMAMAIFFEFEATILAPPIPYIQALSKL